jgi:hypothetical protein
MVRPGEEEVVLVSCNTEEERRGRGRTDDEADHDHGELKLGLFVHLARRKSKPAQRTRRRVINPASLALVLSVQ